MRRFAIMYGNVGRRKQYAAFLTEFDRAWHVAALRSCGYRVRCFETKPTYYGA